MSLEKNIKENLMDFNRETYIKEEDEEDIDFLDCSLGVNPFGPPEKIQEIIKTKSFQDMDLSKYPHPYHKKLKKQIAQFWKPKLKKDLINQIRIGSGSMGILEKINKFLITEQTKVLGIAPQFSEYLTEIEVSAGQYTEVKLKSDNGFKFPTKEFNKKIMDVEPNLVYIDNPNNPTGQLLELKTIKKILNTSLKTDTIVIIDEAYMDFVDDKNSAVNLIDDYKNLIVVRSFSKGSGLAGLRVGYGIFSENIVEHYDKVNLPFQISKISEYLVRKILESYHDQYISEVRKKLATEKEKIMNKLKKNYQISQTHPRTPILLIGKKDKNIDLAKTFKEKGILTQSGKDFKNLGQNYVRIRVPRKSETFLKKLKD